MVLIRRVKTRPPVTRKAATQLEEAALWAEDLKHDRVLPVAAVVESKGELGIVSEVFAGEPLSSVLELTRASGDPLPTPVALAIILDVLEALAFVHETDERQPTRFGGVCAESIIIGSDGHARLREVGLSAVAAATIPWANDPRRAAYRAPEALKLAAKQDARSDLFSVGVLLWEMLVGDYLFEGKTRMAVQQAIRSGSIVRVDAKSGGTVDDAVADIVAQALQRDPEARLASIAEMVEAIQATGQAAESAEDVAKLIETLAGDTMAQRDEKLAAAAEGGVDDDVEGTDRPSQPRKPPPLKRGPSDGDEPKPASRRAPPPRRGPPSKRKPPIRITPKGKPPGPPRRTPEEEALMTGDFEVVALESEPPDAPEEEDEGFEVSFSEPPPAEEPRSPSAAGDEEPEDDKPEEPKDDEETAASEDADEAEAAASRPSGPLSVPRPGGPPRPSDGGEEPAEPKDEAPESAPADEAAAGDEEAPEPTDDEPKDDEPKDDEPKDDEPKDDEPKDDEPKDDEPKDDEPKDDEEKVPSPFADDAEPAEKADDGQDEPKGDSPAKAVAAASATDEDDDDKPVVPAPPIALDASADDLFGVEPQQKSKTPLIIGVTVVLLILIGIWAFSGGSAETTTSTTTAGPSAPTAVATPPTATTSAAPETTSSAVEPSEDEDAGAEEEPEEEDAGAPVADTAPPPKPPSQPGKWPPKRPPKPPKKPPKTTFTPSDI